MGSEAKADSILDTVGLLCPAPIMKTAEKLLDLEEGQILEIISDDPGIEADLPDWCRSTGHTVVGIERRGNEFHALVRKGGGR